MSLLASPTPGTGEHRRGRRASSWGAVAAAGAVVGLVLLGLTLFGVMGSSVHSSGPQGLDVLPFPGTRDASPTTSIAFPALDPSQIKAVTVTGSRSRRHAGGLAALPQGRGTAFTPSRPFTAGERVSVHAVLSSSAAGTASGTRGATQLTFSFTVAAPPANAPAGSSTSSSTTATGSSTGSAKPQPAQSFHSEPNLHPPAVSTSPNPDTTSGDIFLDANNGSQSGPMILDGQGRLVWFDPLPSGQSATDVTVQSYRGQPVLTFWQGTITSGHGDGEDVILNRSYQAVATVRAGNGYQADLHEFAITPQGTALITAYQPVRANLSSIGGPPDGSVLDSVVQEVDIRTGRVLWEWHALGHVPLTASEAGKPTAGSPYDFFHVNSIQQLPDGNLLVSARNTWGVYEISRSTGKVIWTLGGKDSSFKMGAGTQFEWQHDARLQPDGTLTLFDDAASPAEESQSRAITLRLDTTAMRASLDRSYTNTPKALAGSQGSMQVLPNGNVFVGWGADPHFSEYTPDGRQIFTCSFTLPVQSYRAYRFTWTGLPTTKPDVSVTPRPGGGTTVYASWNGATEVARWQLLAGSSPSHLTPTTSATRSDFETAITTDSSARYFAVRALDSAGNALATSVTVAR
jgi:Arylsulfotransferase (ASST)